MQNDAMWVDAQKQSGTSLEPGAKTGIYVARIKILFVKACP